MDDDNQEIVKALGGIATEIASHASRMGALLEALAQINQSVLRLEGQLDRIEAAIRTSHRK